MAIVTISLSTEGTPKTVSEIRKELARLYPALRGIEFEMRAQNGMLAAHGEFVMPVETRPGFQLPALPFGLTPGGSAKPTDKKAAPPAPQKPRLAPAPSGAKPAGKREF